MRKRLGLAVLALGIAALALPVRPTVRAAEKKGNVAIEVGKGQIDFRAGKNLAGRYHFGPAVAKPYFWPLQAPNGVTVTRGWPMVDDAPGIAAGKWPKDHVHQKAAWFCHGDVIPEGIEVKSKIKGIAGVDFWSEAKGHGRIVCTEVGSPRVEGDHGSVVTRNEWRTADGQKIMDETRTIHFYDLGGASLFVLDIDLHASVCPITFADTKEGSMGVRVPAVLTEKAGKGKLTNAEGKTGEKLIWGQKSVWCDYSGPVNGKVAGITLFDDPSNPSPACWHSRAYGLMAANPFGRAGHAKFPGVKDNKETVKLGKGEHLKLRYGMLLHNGNVQEGKVAQIYGRFLKLKG
jgi:Family of unknown function (DUF6807)